MMRSFFLLALAFCLAIAACVLCVSRAACDENEQKIDAAALDARIRQLIAQLGDEDSNVRDKATSELGKVGKPALDALRAATKSTDAEIAWRAEQLVSAIESGRAVAGANADASAEADTDAGTSIVRFPGGRIQVFVKSLSVNPSGSENIERTQTAEGKVTVTIRKKDKDGKEHVETYVADSPEEFAKKFPEIDKRIGFAGINVRIGELPQLRGDFKENWKKERNRIDEMLKKFSDEDFVKLPDDIVDRMRRVLPLDEMLERIFDEDFLLDKDRFGKRLEQSRRRIDEMIKGLRPRDESEGDEESDFGRLEQLLRDSQRRLDELMARIRSGGEEADGSSQDPGWRWDRSNGRDRDFGNEPAPQEGGGESDGTHSEAAVEWNFGAEVGLVDDALRGQLDLPEGEGVIVHSVTKGSGADQAGFRQYDIVLSVNGEKVQNKWDFRRMVLEGLKKRDVAVDVVRKGERMTLRIPKPKDETPNKK
jgi:hypothetical protein